MNGGVLILFFLRIYFIIGMCDGYTLGTKIRNCSAIPRLHSHDEFAAFEFCAFPTTKLTFECVKASCAALSSSTLCPFDNKGKTNEDKLASAATVIIKCLKKSSSICNSTSDLYHIPDNFPSGFSLTTSAFQHTIANFTFVKGQVAMPWLGKGFSITLDGKSRDSLDIDMDTTLKYQTFITGNLDFTLRPVDTFKEKGEFRFIEYHDLGVNLTIHRPSTTLEFKIPSDSSKKPTFSTYSYQSGNTYLVQAERLQRTDWNKAENNKANIDLNRMLVLLIDFTDSDNFMERFIGTYAAYALMALDKACFSPTISGLVNKVTHLL